VIIIDLNGKPVTTSEYTFSTPWKTPGFYF
jgi:hypothetical protein